jgi:Flp pilus assembly protein TadD
MAETLTGMPPDAAAWMARARQHEQAQAWAEAIDAYGQALALAPANAQIRNNLGAVY